MKFATLLVSLSILYGVEATANSSTITCSSCPPSSSTNDIVTRSDVVPTVSCTNPPLMVVVNGTTSVPTSVPSATSEPSSTWPTTPSAVPTAGSNKMMGSMGGAVALAAAVVYLM